MKTYTAPWSTLLIVMSVLATALCIGIAFAVCFLPGAVRGGWLGTALRWLPIVLVPGAALFVVRGYTITPDAILVHRLLWDTRLPREGLQSAAFEPGAMCRSIRTCGNGGLFSFTGWYWSKSLKSYRVFVTEEEPFGPEVVVYKVQGKMFALVDYDSVPPTMNLKCDPDRALDLRDVHEAIRPGYHMNKRHWNTLDLNGTLRSALVAELIRHSHDLVVASLPRRVREKFG